MSLDLDLQVACAETSAIPSIEQLTQWTELALSGRRDTTELTIRIVDEDESAALNQQYRGKDGATNVLSFPADIPAELELPLLGDLVICKQRVEQEALTQHKALFEHWAHLVIHGTLHLLGFDHIDNDDAEEMESLEIALLSELGIANPYMPTL